MFAVKFALVFMSLVVVDICWTLYISKVNEGRAAAAACWSAMIMVCGAFATVSYLHDIRLLVAAVMGAWVGTYVTVAFKNRRLRSGT